ncbi:MAG TPA: bifunctional 3-deoxy-7-phosphoheptulonate synthase/chorismate mutase [Acidimicrobiia bacterium]|nr:bifunctional 3-deoxy-7-phosphoheptulonate synthase/chorismate mutase [Acidimicrobiia bacterium]
MSTHKEEHEDDVAQIRDDIDRVDAEILKLLAERKAFSIRMAREKGIHDRPSRDMSREEDLISDRINSGMSHDLDSGLVNRVWREIINDSVRVQQEFLGRSDSLPGSVTVAIQGIDGSYSHLASQQFFDSKGITPSYVRSATFADALRAVQEGVADVAMLPVENTTSGAISEVYDLLLDSQLKFVGDVRFRVRHCLLGVAGASVNGLRRIYCHPQAVTQCSEFLAGLDHVELVYFSDTALSGKRIGEVNDPTVAAIASEEAARLYGLDVLKTGIANQEENYTRFVVVSATPAEVPDGVPSKTSIVMAVGNHPGALMDALAVFREADINLVMLESRPIPNNPREELFYLDFDGNISDPVVQSVFDSLTKQLRFLRIMGSYPSRDLRPRPVEREVARVEPKGLSALAAVAPAATPKGYKLGSRVHKAQNTVIEVAGVEVGAGEMIMIAGPCAVESWDQVMATAKAVKEAGGSILRGGCFKPRSSPYSFQGLGYEGLEMLVEAGRAYGLPVVTEVLSPDDVEGVAKKADILQIGARNMQNFSLLSAAGRAHRPVLLKRGMSSSIEELLQAAEYILAGGNQQLMLCERGIRTFETSTRNTLDLSAVPVLRRHTHLPIIVDPSHAAGDRDLVAPLALAAQAIGADGIMVEIHPNPEEALSDGPQSLRLDQFGTLMGALGFAPAAGGAG